MDIFNLKYNKNEFLYLGFFNSSTDEEFYSIHRELVNLQKTSKIKHRLLVNTVGIGVLSLSRQKMITDELIPLMSEQAGRQMHVALVTGDDVFASFATKNIGQKLKKTSKVKLFNKETEAESWLLGLEEVQTT
ncbi:hypothetical protein FUAX_46180 (plasmid) [Fulvitalea axinellae]|uniref:STAS/SEC14 domain-containing protein n=1 Tax=Fulvitalea axinellae TaxID=1182444 RepID=A0AAU9CJ92_9BACT|nr:hypothetical protein FUAX_46180 [Fulvitalea axinellae]